MNNFLTKKNYQILTFNFTHKLKDYKKSNFILIHYEILKKYQRIESEFFFTI